MTRIGGQWPSLVALVTSLTGAGCSSFGGGIPSQWWHQSIVVGVQSLARLSSGVDAHCVDALPDGSDDKVVLVKYRVGRAPYLQAFPIPAGRLLNPGETVVAHPSQCTIRWRPFP